MKVLNPNDSSFELYVITRDMTITSDLTMTITKEGTNVSETLAVTPGYSENHCVIVAPITILVEGHYYSFSLADSDGNLVYRDRIFATEYSNDYYWTINNGKFTADTSTDGNQYIIHE